MMDREQLAKIMVFQLRSFNRTENEVTTDTVHSSILSKDDGLGGITSATLYKSFVRYSIKHAGLEDKKWPENWFDLTITQLSEKLI